MASIADNPLVDAGLNALAPGLGTAVGAIVPVVAAVLPAVGEVIGDVGSAIGGALGSAFGDTLSPLDDPSSPLFQRGGRTNISAVSRQLPIERF